MFIMSNIKRFLTVFLLGLVIKAGVYVDLLGRRVEVAARPRRIICVGPGALRLMVYLRAQDRVVGVEEIERRFFRGRPYILAHPELKSLPVFAKGGPPGENPLNYEKIILLKPDLIFATYLDRGEAERISSKVRAPVVVLSYGELATFEEGVLFRSLRLAGKILGREARAERLIRYIRATIEDLKDRTSGIKRRPRVYIGGLGHRGSHGIDSSMGEFPVFRLVGAENLADTLRIRGWISVDREKILQWDPDYIFVDEGGLEIVLEDVRRNPSFYRALTAVREGRVYGLLPFNYYTTNIEVALASGYFVGKVLYPEKFRDIEIEKKADEIFNFFVGKPVYQAMKRDYGGYRRLNLLK